MIANTLLLLYNDKVFLLMNIVDSLKNKAKQYKYIVIGELHGVQENVLVLEDLLKEGIVKVDCHATFAFEWSLTKKENIVLNDYLSGKIQWSDKRFEKIINKLYQEQSGVFSDQHLLFIKKVKSINLKKHRKIIKIIGFSHHSDDWNRRDQLMAKSVMEMSEDTDTVFVLTGNLHARRYSFSFGENQDTLVPLAFHLPVEQTFSVKISYKKGRFYNFGLKDINESKDDSSEKFYDTLFCLEKATPITLSLKDFPLKRFE